MGLCDAPVNTATTAYCTVCGRYPAVPDGQILPLTAVCRCAGEQDARPIRHDRRGVTEPFCSAQHTRRLYAVVSPPDYCPCCGGLYPVFTPEDEARFEAGQVCRCRYGCAASFVLCAF